MELQRKQITIKLSEIFSLVSCASDYGFEDEVLLEAFATWCNKQVTDVEIENYCSSFLTEEYRKQGYSIVDYGCIKTRLLEWRSKYCK